MQRVLVRSLSHRYNERIRDLQYLIGGARALRPCSSYVISQSNCAPKHKDAPKCPNDHIDRKTAAANFPLRVRVVIRVMALLDSMMPDATTSSGSEDEMTLIIGKKNMQRIWLDRLFQTLYPVYSGLGSLHTLDKEIFREHASWLHVVQAWLKARLFLMRPVEKHINSYLTNILNVALLGSGLDRQNFRSYSARIRCSRYPDSKHYQNFENPLLHAETGVTVVREMFSCLRGSWERGFQAGMRSLRHIIAHPELPVDIHALITFVERIITLAAFSLASSRAQHQPLRCWNSILLPKTWVIHGLTQKPAKAQTRDLPIETLIVTIGLIMKRMAESDRPHQDDRVIPLSSTTASSFTYQSLPFGQTGKARVPYGLRCIFRARLCYALVIRTSSA
ncbi:hypothetical protein FRC03_008301 [Tulasnella sp. 419]|nr:hypothetical protein FRC03_008301 [Tulasnella sp. 419]